MIRTRTIHELEPRVIAEIIEALRSGKAEITEVCKDTKRDSFYRPVETKMTATIMLPCETVSVELKIKETKWTQ